MKNAPATLFAHVDANALFTASGESVRRVDLANGTVAWEKPLKKVTGEISGKDGAIVTREEVWMVTGTTSFGLVADEERETEVVPVTILVQRQQHHRTGPEGSGQDRTGWLGRLDERMGVRSREDSHGAHEDSSGDPLRDEIRLPARFPEGWFDSLGGEGERRRRRCV